jgi:hypothetical protein
MKCIKKCHFSGIKKCLPLHPLHSALTFPFVSEDPHCIFRYDYLYTP